MTVTPTGPYLVIRREDGYGDVFPLDASQRCLLGRANTNRIVLKDELCSREHAEVAFAEGRWRLRDLKSLNGTRVQGAPINEWELTTGDDFQVGHTTLVFVEQLQDLPHLSHRDNPEEAYSIKKRWGRRGSPRPFPRISVEDVTETVGRSSRSLSRDLSLLYRLAINMASALSYEDLVNIVLDGLLEAIPAEVGRYILTMRETGTLELTAAPAPGSGRQVLLACVEFVSNEVISSREAVLAEDVGLARSLPFILTPPRIACRTQKAKRKTDLCARLFTMERSSGSCIFTARSTSLAFREDSRIHASCRKQLAIVTAQMQRESSLTEENQNLREQLRVESELIGDSQPHMKDIHEPIMPRRGYERDRSRPRRIGQRQRAGRPRDPLFESAAFSSLHLPQLRRHNGNAARIRIVRPRKRGIYRRH